MLPIAATTIDLSAPQVLTLMVGGVGGFISLIYWLVRLSFKRQGEITDRYFGHLERKDQEQQENIKLFGDAMKKMGDAMDEHTVLLKSLHDKTKCNYPLGGKE